MKKTKGMTEAQRIEREMSELAKRYFKLHEQCYNEGADERITDMYYDAYSRITRVLTDLSDAFLYLSEGKHFDGYGVTFGLHEDTLKPIDLEYYRYLPNLND